MIFNGDVQTTVARYLGSMSIWGTHARTSPHFGRVNCANLTILFNGALVTRDPSDVIAAGHWQAPLCHYIFRPGFIYLASDSCLTIGALDLRRKVQATNHF